MATDSRLGLTGGSRWKTYRWRWLQAGGLPYGESPVYGSDTRRFKRYGIPSFDFNPTQIWKVKALPLSKSSPKIFELLVAR